MRYVMLIHNRPEAGEEWNALTTAEKEVEIEAHREWFRKHGKEGRIVGGEELASPETGRIVRRRNGAIVITDGPYVETREALGGFVVIDAPDIATVEAMAAEWPGLLRWNAVMEIVPTDNTTAE